ncbi:MAG: nucleoside phosphorylase [Spirochaetes bacterium]|nr:nucleoside phosphorylase [Spirochaetota bacterium]
MSFKAEHMNANSKDFEGNSGIGRYIFLPGSDGRAKQIAENFANVTVKEHSRRHNIYKGTLVHNNKKIDVAAVASGMGTPSLDIIVNELYRLGAKRFLRVGTAGLLQPKYMKAGDFVIGTGAVKDDGATQNYVPPEIPALSSLDFVLAAQKAGERLNYSSRIHTGLMHSKGSLYAREFKSGPQAEDNEKYMKILTDAGVLASEMEASMLFTLASIFHHQVQLKKQSKAPADQVKAGAICVILGEGDDFGTEEMLKKITSEVIDLSLQTIKELATQEL